MKCYICVREAPGRRLYCDRCIGVLKYRPDRIKRRDALKAAYDEEHDGFRCHFSGVLLEEDDRWDPFHLTFDHIVPVKSSGLVVCASVFNLMKTQLTGDEFQRAVRELVAHHDGKPFDRDCIPFAHWNLKAPRPRAPENRPHRETLGKVTASECVVCGDPPVRWSYYCERCRDIVWAHKGNQRMRVKALKAAWDPDLRGFVCHYTGVRVDENDPGSPWCLNFDHSVPGEKKSLVVAAYWVNLVKTALSEDEFWAVIKELDACWREERVFDRGIVPFEHWRPVRRPKGVLGDQ